MDGRAIARGTCAALLALSLSAPAQTAHQRDDSQPERIYVGRKVSVDFQDASIHDVLDEIGRFSKLTFVASQDVTGTVTLRRQDVPWDQLLDEILDAKSLDRRRLGNIVRIDTQANFAQERAERVISCGLPVHTLLLPVTVGTPDERKRRLEPFLSANGKITIDPRTNTLLVQDHAEELQRIRELSKAIDAEGPWDRLRNRLR